MRCAIGAEQTELLESKSIGPLPHKKVVPKGITHAVPVGTVTSLCGRQGLHIFDDQDWEPANITEQCERFCSPRRSTAPKTRAAVSAYYPVNGSDSQRRGHVALGS